MDEIVKRILTNNFLNEGEDNPIIRQLNWIVEKYPVIEGFLQNNTDELHNRLTAIKVEAAKDIIAEITVVTLFIINGFTDLKYQPFFGKDSGPDIEVNFINGPLYVEVTRVRPDYDRIKHIENIKTMIERIRKISCTLDCIIKFNDPNHNLIKKEVDAIVNFVKIKLESIENIPLSKKESMYKFSLGNNMPEGTFSAWKISGSEPKCWGPIPNIYNQREFKRFCNKIREKLRSGKKQIRPNCRNLIFIITDSDNFEDDALEKCLCKIKKSIKEKDKTYFQRNGHTPETFAEKLSHVSGIAFRGPWPYLTNRNCPTFLIPHPYNTVETAKLTDSEIESIRSLNFSI